MVNSLIKSLSEAEQYVNTINHKLSCKVATTGNITLSGTQTIDGIAVSVNERVLVTNQSIGSENGIYICSSGGWFRSTDMDSNESCRPNSFLFIEQGSTHADKMFHLTNHGDIEIDNTILTFEEYGISGVTSITPGDGITGTDTTGDITLSLDVDDTTLEINASGEASAKTAPVANGATTLATGDQIYDYVTTNTVLLTTNQTVAGSKTFSDSMIINGNLQVSGTTTTVNSTTVDINDFNIRLNSGNNTNAVLNNAGITLDGGTGDDLTWAWNSSSSNMELKLGSQYAGMTVNELTGNVTGDVAGNSDTATRLENSININNVSFDGYNDITVPAAGSTLTDTVPIGKGGTGAITASEARTNLGAGTVTSVSGTGTVNGLRLFGSVSSSGNLSLEGTLSINNSDWSGTPLSVANGGTGQTTYSSGDLLIGNNSNTLTKTTLTQGNNISITNGDGSITIAGNYSVGDGGLTQTNFTTTLKTKLDGIAANANNYSLPLCADETRGGVQIGYTENGKNYPVELSSEKMFVNVPWTDTNTTYSVGDGGLTQKNFTTTLNTKLDGIAANANNYSLPLSVSGTKGGVQIGYTENGQNYPVELDSEKMFVNVPWTDNNTTYSNGTGLDLTGTTFSVNSDVVLLTGSQTLTDKTFVSAALGTPTSGILTNCTGTASGLTVGNSTISGTCSGNAATATALQSARTINGVSFDGTGNITIAAQGTTLSDIVPITKGGTGQTSFIDGELLIGNSSGHTLTKNTLTGGTGITITNGSGSITISSSSSTTLSFSGDTGTALDIGNNEELKILGGDGLGLTLSTNAYDFSPITTKGAHKATTTSDTITRNAWYPGDAQNPPDAQNYTSQVLYTASNPGYCHMEFKISLGSSSPPQFAGLIKSTSSPTVSDNYQFPSMYSLSYAGSQGIRYYDGSWNPTYEPLSSTDLLSITYDETNGSGTITYKKNGTTLGSSVVGTGLTFHAKFEMYQSEYYSSELLMYNSISVLPAPIVGPVIEIIPSSGTLNVAHGGTGASSFTTNGLLIGNGNSAISSGSSLTFNGSALYVDGDINATGSINASYTSDRRLKENLNIIDEPINKITKINGYYFDWITNPEIHSNTGRDVGVIAQEIKEILPEIVGERHDGYLAVRYDNIIPLLIECIKENRRDINELKNKLSELTI